MLYRIGMSLTTLHLSRQRRSVDNEIYDYQGPRKRKECKGSGWYKATASSLNLWIHTPNRRCMGLCGKRCDCWKWVCGDCCIHTGCLEHDNACKSSWWSTDCWNPFRLNDLRSDC